MSIEEEIRRIVNEELDRRVKDDNLRKFIEEDDRSLWEGKWNFSEIATPEPSGPGWRGPGWYHVCENSGGVPVDIFLPIGGLCPDCGASMSKGGS